jgi:carbamoyltransferase
MEFGPRALGNRSILGDPRSPAMQKALNLKVKYRESFRTFAPSVLRERVADWFEIDADSPYMLIVANVKPERCRTMSVEQQALFGIDKLNVARSDIPAVTHVDYSARVQTVHQETNPRYHALIARFEQLTGCPVLVKRALTCVASRSSAPRRRLFAVSWGPGASFSRPEIAFFTKTNRTRVRPRL